MDAAKIGDRKLAEKKELTPEEYKKRETIIFSPYAYEGHWLHGLKASGYELIGEFKIGDNLTLYRYELDENKRTNDEAHYISIIIDSTVIPIESVGGSLVKVKKKKNE